MGTVNERSEDFPSFSMDRYRILVEQAQDIIFEADLFGFFTFVNSRTTEILGYSRNSLLQKKYTELIREDFLEKIVAFYRHQLATETKTTYFEFPVIAESGATIWLGQHVQLVYRGSELKGIMAVARVITDKIRAINSLKQSEEKYRGIIQNLQFGLIEVDLEERIIYINDAMCQITGYTREEMMGKVASQVLTNDAMREEINKQHELRKNNQSSVYEAKILTKSGEPLYAMISGAPTYDSLGQQIGSIGIHVDISVRKSKEIQLFESQQFLSAINKFVTRLLEVDTVEDISQEIVSHIVTSFGFDNAEIYILNEFRNIFELKASHYTTEDPGELPLEINFDQGIIGAVASTGKAELVTDTFLDHRYLPQQNQYRSEIAVPIKVENKVIGVINSEHPEVDFFTAKDLESLQTIANLSASRIKNAKAKRRQEAAERELRESEQKLLTITKSALDAIITINEQGLIQEWNPRAEEIFGWKAAEAIGTDLTTNIIPTQHHRAHHDGMVKYL
ncbi:MAG: PAS domain S-box protein, partial [Algoriphagus sp.]